MVYDLNQVHEIRQPRDDSRFQQMWISTLAGTSMIFHVRWHGRIASFPSNLLIPLEIRMKQGCSTTLCLVLHHCCKTKATGTGSWLSSRIQTRCSYWMLISGALSMWKLPLDKFYIEIVTEEGITKTHTPTHTTLLKAFRINVFLGSAVTILSLRFSFSPWTSFRPMDFLPFVLCCYGIHQGRRSWFWSRPTCLAAASISPPAGIWCIKNVCAGKRGIPSGGFTSMVVPKTDGVWKIPNKNGWWWFGGTPMTSWLGVWSSYGGFCSKFHGWFGGFRDPWGYPHSWMVYGWENHRKSPWKWMITRGTPILGHIHLFCDCFVTEVCDPHGSCAECCQGAWSCTTSLVTGPPRNDHCLSVLVPVDKNEPLTMPLLMSCLFNWLGVIPTGLLVYGYCSNLLYPLD